MASFCTQIYNHKWVIWFGLGLINTRPCNKPLLSYEKPIYVHKFEHSSSQYNLKLL